MRQVVAFAFIFSATLLCGHEDAVAQCDPAQLKELQTNINWCCDRTNKAKDRDRITGNLRDWVGVGRPNEGTPQAKNYLYEIRDGYKECQGKNPNAKALGSTCTSQQIAEIAYSAGFCKP